MLRVYEKEFAHNGKLSDPLLEEQMKPISSLYLQELSPCGRERRECRLRLLKKSLENNCYDIDSRLIAGGMIHEAMMDAASRRRRN